MDRRRASELKSMEEALIFESKWVECEETIECENSGMSVGIPQDIGGPELPNGSQGNSVL